MKYFVGIVPPAGISNAIYEIQKPFGNNRLEPHITVRPPIAITGEMEWLNAIERFAKISPPFKIELTTTGMFGKGVLFINASSIELMGLHKELIAAVAPFEQKTPHEKIQQDYHPHLTLGRIWCGFTQHGFSEMKKLANELLKQPVFFEATFLRVYVKPKSNSSYSLLKDVWLM